MENNYCIYKHTAPNGKVYIGLTGREPQKRWNSGYGYKISNPHFWSAIKKYGWLNIKHEILLEGLNKQQASEFEKMYISIFNSADRRYGYNKTYGGEVGARPNKETRLKFSGGNHHFARKIEQYSLNGEYLKTFDCIANAAKELNVCYSSIASCARHEHYKSFGFIWVYEDDPQKEFWIKKDMKDYTHGGNNPTARKIIQYDLNGNYIKTYTSIKEAADKLNVKQAHITQCARGQRISAHRYLWAYDDTENIETFISNKVKEKMHGGKMWSGGNHQSRSINQYDLDGNYIQTYPSIADASRFLGISVSNISGCAGNKKNITAGGYIWKFTDSIEG